MLYAHLIDNVNRSKDVQNHLTRVYGLLAVTLACAAVGSFVHILYNVGGFLTLFGAIGLILALTLCVSPKTCFLS